MALIRKTDSPKGVPTKIVESAAEGFALQFAADLITKELFPSQKQAFLGLIETTPEVEAKVGEGFKVPPLGQVIFQNPRAAKPDVDGEALFERVRCGTIPLEVFFGLVKDIDAETLRALEGQADLVTDKPVDPDAFTLTFRANADHKAILRERFDAAGLKDKILAALLVDAPVETVIEEEPVAVAKPKRAAKRTAVKEAA